MTLLISVLHTFLRKGYGPEDIAITKLYLDRLKEVPDLCYVLLLL